MVQNYFLGNLFLDADFSDIAINAESFRKSSDDLGLDLRRRKEYGKVENIENSKLPQNLKIFENCIRFGISNFFWHDLKIYDPKISEKKSAISLKNLVCYLERHLVVSFFFH